jgi:hypothetical protein
LTGLGHGAPCPECSVIAILPEDKNHALPLLFVVLVVVGILAQARMKRRARALAEQVKRNSKNMVGGRKAGRIPANADSSAALQKKTNCYRLS